MKKRVTASLLVITLIFLMCGHAFAREGICGYEGGISSGEVPDNTTFDYKEVTFISGKPVVFEGTLLIKKSQRQDKLTTTYTYNLRNGENTLTRVLTFTTEAETKENGQIAETVSLTSASERVIIDGVTYTIPNRNNYQFARSTLIDPKPAVTYHAGSIWSRKVYQVGPANDGNTVTVECTGTFYGYDQYWGNAESLLLDYVISGERNTGDGVDVWGGTATIAISSTSTEQLEYYENRPNQISFAGSYVQSRMNSNVLEYTCMLPEFDSKGISTDRIVTYSDSLIIETFPVQKRLASVDVRNARGHWAENDIRLMFGLEVFKGDGSNFYPDNYMTRAEFAAAMAKVAREVPQDPTLVKRTTTTRRTTGKEVVVSPFNDVSINNIYFNEIRNVYERGIMLGRGDNRFAPNDYITKAEATVAFIRALGFESLAPAPVAVTSFRDNDLIPEHARNAAYVAQKIGLIQSDSRGNMNPNKKLTKAEGAAMFRSLIRYLQEGIRKDYRDRLINYY
ncbi:MAG TPA: S-layer homology domain-containing protein [Clostridiales bacterium]|nr:S-layer homology domain-containing protein [Clostridiales bacterium]HPV02578.1 S-layer homology domain-containing protein [Clostridiales bacterium]